MNICPITYEPCEGKYSSKGLRTLSPRLKRLADLPLTAEEQIREIAARSVKMSIQGVQPKLSAKLNTAGGHFEIVDTGGRYVLKPQTPHYLHLPENEDLSMRLASEAGVETPVHGLVYSKDASLTYFVKRFDRVGRNKKRSMEDFAQLLGLSRDTKYSASMEKVALVIDKFCTFPVLEKIKLFRLTMINFLIGNEDMHLKNFSLITRDGKVELSPAYDILNTSIALARPQEQIALPIKGKKNKLTKDILDDYFGRECLGLNNQVRTEILEKIEYVSAEWKRLIGICFLSDEAKGRYAQLLESRRRILFQGS